MAEFQTPLNSLKPWPLPASNKYLLFSAMVSIPSGTRQLTKDRLLFPSMPASAVLLFPLLHKKIQFRVRGCAYCVHVHVDAHFHVMSKSY